MQICVYCFQSNAACEQCGGIGVIRDASLPDLRIVKDIQTFASKETPLHASAIPELIKCALRPAMIHLFPSDYESSEAADTGSLTHVGVADWHRNKDIVAAIQAMTGAQSRFPQGSLAEATAMFYLYSQDERNAQAEIAKDKEGRLLLEYPLSAVLQAAESDPTKAPIYIVGTLDQVRVVNGRKRVFDLKTSKRPAYEQSDMYVYQIATYSFMVSVALGEPVPMGGLIMPRHYKSDPANLQAHVEFSHKFSDVLTFVNGVRFAVAHVRAGHVHPAPGPHCRYCPFGPTSNCAPMLRAISDEKHQIRRP